jgi:hypothetical protein
MASLSVDGTWHNKYHFQDLEIGESMEVCGVEQNIRSAASMYGTRYGVWLQCTKIDDGYTKVTRIESPIRPRKQETSRHDRLVERMDAMAELLRLILKKLNDQAKPK